MIDRNAVFWSPFSPGCKLGEQQRDDLLCQDLQQDGVADVLGHEDALQERRAVLVGEAVLAELIIQQLHPIRAQRLFPQQMGIDQAADVLSVHAKRRVLDVILHLFPDEGIIQLK